MALITESALRKLKIAGIPNPYLLNEGDKVTPAAMDFLRDNNIKVINHTDDQHRTKLTNMANNNLTIPVGVSNRHIHLSKLHLERLFGEGYQLQEFKELSQPDQFAAEEQVTLLGPKGLIQKVRVLGPVRNETQVEISKTDGFTLGIHPPVRLSGAIENTPGVSIIGPKGSIVIDKGVIIAKAHIHMSPQDAKRFNVIDKDDLMLQSTGDRSVIFPEVTVRINERFALDCHVDLDEGNAANIKNGEHVKVIGKNGEFFI